MFAKKYVLEAIGTAILTLSILLTNNPMATGFLWASLLIIRNNKSHGYFNLAITCSLYAARYISMKQAALFCIYQVLGSLAALISFKYISGSYFAPDATIVSSFSLLNVIEGLSTLIVCLTILAVYTVNKEHNASSHVHTALISATTLIGLQTIGAIVYPSFGCAVLLSTFFDISNELFIQQLRINIHYSLIYCIVPMAMGLCSYQLKRWIDEPEVF
ncbi:MAG TPA: aquaporin [Patescibacteria group bacterium]|jgi:glycerol uptake facilitator-like aquaporin|nr:aquaporin [Patescibacteria group bacterium]